MIRVWLPTTPRTPSTGLAQVRHDDVDQVNSRPSRRTHIVPRLYHHLQIAERFSNPLDNGPDPNSSSSPSLTPHPLRVLRVLGRTLFYPSIPRRCFWVSWGPDKRRKCHVKAVDGKTTNDAGKIHGSEPYQEEYVFYATDSYYTISTQFYPEVAGLVRPNLRSRLPCSLRMRFGQYQI